ncbi:MAG: glycosyltransferase family 39 protein, partial [Bdellovibrionota bacterium]
EALHLLWGFVPSYGYSDHPAMTGWFAWASMLFGHSHLSYRVTCLLSSLLVTEGIRRMLLPYGIDRARLVAAIYALTPMGFFGLIFTPEIPLLIFVFFGAMAILKASKLDSAKWALIAGLLQSAAILSKYNALWFGAAAFYFFVLRPQSRSAKLTIAYGLGCLPCFAIIGFYNYEHCWINWSRASARMAGKDILPLGLFVGLAYQLLAGTPWAWWAYVSRDDRRATFAELRKILPLFFFVPLVCYLYVSLQNKVGAHWMQSFYPFFFLLLVEAKEKNLQLCLKLNALTVGLMLIIAVAFLNTPLSWFASKSPRYHHDVVIAFDPKGVCDALQNFGGPDATLATFDYSQASTLWVSCLKPVLRYGYGALDGRDFDHITDYRSYDGKPLALIWQNEFDEKKLMGAILKPRFGSFMVDGKLFFAAVGQFSYSNYKENVLRPQLDKLYDPENRDLPNQSCYFKQRYFPEYY